MLSISNREAIGMAILESTASVLCLLQQSHSARKSSVSGMGADLNLVRRTVLRSMGYLSLYRDIQQIERET